MKIVSLNIRNGLADDGINSWQYRRDAVADLLLSFDADVLCLQEAFAFQVSFLADRLTHYRWFGVGRDDGNSMGEFAPIFVHKRLGAPRDEGTFWLSETPNVPGSLGWGARTTRICTFVRLEEADVLNVHLDHESTDARLGSVELLLHSIKPDSQAVLVGDFNAAPDEAPILRLKAEGFVDIAQAEGPTYNEWSEDPAVHAKIDYVFAKAIKRSFGHVVREPRVSDHWPLVCTLEF